MKELFLGYIVDTALLANSPVGDLAYIRAHKTPEIAIEAWMVYSGALEDPFEQALYLSNVPDSLYLYKVYSASAKPYCYNFVRIVAQLRDYLENPDFYLD